MVSFALFLLEPVVPHGTGLLIFEVGRERGQRAAADGGGGGVLVAIHGRSRMTIHPRIPTMPGLSTSDVHRPGMHCLLALGVERRAVFGESHEG